MSREPSFAVDWCPSGKRAWGGTMGRTVWTGFVCWVVLGAWGCSETEPGGDDATGASGGTSASTGAASSGGQSVGGSSGGEEGEGASSTGGAGGSSEPIPSAGVSTVAEFCAVFPTAMAAYMATCEGGSVTMPDCGAAVRSESAGRVSLNVEQADLCLHVLGGDECASIPCSQVLVGTVPKDGTCNNLDTLIGDECAPGFYCPATRTGACASSCIDAPLLEEGESCAGNGNNDTCPAPLQCDAEAICNMPMDEGESCRASGDCRPDLHCVFLDEDEPSLGGSCELRTAGDGDPCDSLQDCVPGYHCLGAEGAKACVLPKGVGEHCIFGWNECAQQCSLEGECELASEEGDPCGQVEDVASGESELLQCAADFYCETESSTCQKRIEVGTSCAGILALGDPCERGSEAATECAMGACQLCEWTED